MRYPADLPIEQLIELTGKQPKHWPTLINALGLKAEHGSANERKLACDFLCFLLTAPESMRQHPQICRILLRVGYRPSDPIVPVGVFLRAESRNALRASIQLVAACEQLPQALLEPFTLKIEQVHQAWIEDEATPDGALIKMAHHLRHRFTASA